MHKPTPVQILQRTESRRQHHARFLRRQRTLRQNLREILLRRLLGDIEDSHSIHLRTSRLKNANQIRMFQFARRPPALKLLLSVRPGRNQLDGGVLRPSPLVFPGSKKNGTAIRPAQIAPERKLRIDGPPLPVFPILAHISSLDSPQLYVTINPVGQTRSTQEFIAKLIAQFIVTQFSVAQFVVIVRLRLPTIIPASPLAALYNTPMASIPAAIHGQRYISLATFRKSGVPVYTPVWFAEDANKLFFTTNSKLGKCKRIRNNPQAKIAPCTMRGKITGPESPATARILPPEELARVRQLIKQKYWLARLPFLWRNTDTSIEITPA